MIDVSQCVETSHPKALEFLKRDIFNLNLYFNKKGIAVFRLSMIFDFIIDRKLTPENRENKIEEMIENSLEDLNLDPSKKEFEVFLGVNIPTSLYDMDIMQMERDVKKGEFSNYIYSKLVGLDEADVNSKEENDEHVINNETGDLLDNPDEEEELEGCDKKLKELKVMDETNQFGEVIFENKDEEKPKKIIGDALYGHLSKEERKKKVKEDKKEKRKTKMPKKTKKKLVSKTNRKGK